VALDRLFPGQDDQGANVIAREVGRAAHERVRGPGGRGGSAAAAQAPDREPFEKLPELFLEDHDDDHQKDREEALEDPGHQSQVQSPRGNVSRAEDQDAERHQRGLRAPQPREGRVQQRGHQEDVDDVEQADIAERVKHGLGSLPDG